MTLEIRVLTAAERGAALQDVARLRIKVFREWPYLYDGDLSYEKTYLARYHTTCEAVIVGAFDGTKLVGASTGMPLVAHADDFTSAFSDATVDMKNVFYCAESVLLPAYRGRGIGHRFFDLREEAGRSFGYQTSAFCAVIRSKDHPSRPTAYRPLDPFWRARGYAPMPRAIASFEWKDIDSEKPTSKELQFWTRVL